MTTSIVAERWLPVVGWEGIYEVSDQGRLRRISGSRRGIISGKRTRPDGYVISHFSANNREGNILVHRIVLCAFVGMPTPDKPEANHKNGKRDDNRAENLEWCSRSENCSHAFRVLGRDRRCGEKASRAKLTADQVRSIRARYSKGGVFQKTFAAEFGVTQASIHAIISGKSWAHLL